jgi:hypothetical protein
VLAKIISLFLVVIPWMIFPRPDVYDQTRMIKAVFFDFACISIIIYGLYYGVINRYKNKILASLTLYIFVIQFFNWYKPLICSYNKQIVLNLWTIEPFLHFILAISASFIALSSLNKDDFKVIGKCLAWSAIAVSGYIVLQKFNIDPWGQILWKPRIFVPIVAYSTENNHCVAMLDNPVITGGYLGLCFPFLLSLRKWWSYLFAVCICLILLWVDSLGGIAILLLGSLIYFFLTQWEKERLTYKVICWSIISFIIVSMIYFIQKFDWSSDFGSNSFNGRLRIISESWEYFKINPLWGKGLGVFQTYTIKLGKLWAKEAHCDFLERLCEIGIIGVGIFICLIINSIKNFKFDRSNRNAIAFFSSFICFLVLMLFSFPIENGALALTGLVIFWAVETL